MTDAILQFPKPGTKLTYCDATAAYDNLEDRLLGRAYGPALRPAAEMHDLLWSSKPSRTSSESPTTGGWRP